MDMTQSPGVGVRLFIRRAARFGLRENLARPRTLERDVLFVSQKSGRLASDEASGMAGKSGIF
jgi:hypothetical protein